MAAGTFGLFLWLQLASSALARELALTEPSGLRLVVYAVPAVLLAVGVIFPLPVVTLLLFPTSFGAVLIVSPASVDASLTEPLAFTFAVVTLVAYVLSAGAWLRAPAEDPLLDVTRAPFHVAHDRWRPYRGTFLPRIFLLVAAFCATAGALPLLPDLAANVAASFGGSGDPLAVETGLVLCNLILFFMWCVLAYVMFLGPAVEVEIRTRQLETRLLASVSGTPTARRKVAFGLTVLAALALMTALLLLRYA